LLDDQGKINNFSGMPLDEVEEGKLMRDEVRRHTCGEAMANAFQASMGFLAHVTPQEQQFYHLRQSVVISGMAGREDAYFKTQKRRLQNVYGHESIVLISW
jgi:hypothetical protein